MVVEKSEVPGIAVQCELLLPKGHFPRTYEFDIADIGLRRRLVRRFFAILIVGSCRNRYPSRKLMYYFFPFAAAGGLHPALSGVVAEISYATYGSCWAHFHGADHVAIHVLLHLEGLA